MRCPIEAGNEAETMVALAGGRLTPAQREALELHMAECAACRRLADAQNLVWSALEAWTVPAVSTDFDGRLFARIAAEKRRPWWKGPVEWFSWKPALPVAAACAALLGVFLLHEPVWHDSAPAAPSTMAQPADAQKVDVDQVERTLDDMDMLNQLDAPPPAGS